MEFHTFPRIHCHPNHHQQHYQLSGGVGEGEKFVENSNTFEGAVDGGCGGGELLHLCGLLTNGGWMEMAAVIEWLLMSVVDLRGMEAEDIDAAMFREIQKMYSLSAYTFPLTFLCLSIPIHPHNRYCCDFELNFGLYFIDICFYNSKGMFTSRLKLWCPYPVHQGRLYR